jgi:ribonuclease P protein subunit POP4
MNANEVYLMEFIGRNIRVKSSHNVKNNGINGKLVNETKNMMFIDNGVKTCGIPKTGTIFEISFEDKLYNIDGDAMLIRPEDRTKEKRKIYKKLRREKNE